MASFLARMFKRHENDGATFTRLFGKSPVSPLQQHMQIAHRAAEELVPFMQAVIRDDWRAAERCADEISRLEGEADDLKREIRQGLPKGTFLPFARTDLLELLIMQDTIANVAQDIAGLIRGRRAQIPGAISKLMLEFLEESVRATGQATRALAELDDLVSTGFIREEVDLVEQLVSALDEVEHRTDLMQVNVRAELFKVEKGLNPVDVMFLYRIIDWIGQLADAAESVGNRMLYLTSR